MDFIQFCGDFYLIYLISIQRSIFLIKTYFQALEDGRFVLNEVDSFKEWTKPDIPRRYTREVDRIFKK